MTKEKILIADDEVELAELVKDFLSDEQYEALVARDGHEALELFRMNQPQLVILDIMMPGLDGMEVCRRIRAESNVPIIMLSAKKAEVDKILGLGLGADDYIVKPFSPGEVVARVKAQLRRFKMSAVPAPKTRLLSYSGLEINVQLIASISHDLRTPLSSIRGYVEGLPKAVHDPEKLNRYLSVLKNKTALLDTLIERLFEYSQLDMDDSQGAFCLWDAKEMLESILAPVELEFVDQPVQLLLARPLPSVPIEANPDQIAQVFDNLISNARRYLGEKGTIAIGAKVEGADLHISVTDDGTGIAPEDLPHVFEQFYRAEKSRSRSFGGAGLGLAICQKIIENHGGEIWVESEVGVGTRFNFRLPVLTHRPSALD